MTHRMKTAIVPGIIGVVMLLGACGSANPSPTSHPSTTPSDLSTPSVSPAPTSTPAAPPATATPSPTAAPLPVLTTKCAVVGTAQGGAVSWSGASAYNELLISPGNVVVNPVPAQGQYGPLNAGGYMYEFVSAVSTDDARGSFTVAACAT